MHPVHCRPVWGHGAGATLKPTMYYPQGEDSPREEGGGREQPPDTTRGESLWPALLDLGAGSRPDPVGVLQAAVKRADHLEELLEQHRRPTPSTK